MFKRLCLIYILPLIVLILTVSFSSSQKKRIIFFGDSITELGVKSSGYVTLLKSRLDSNTFELVGKGVSGNKVYDLFLRLKQDVLVLKPATVVIYIGVNDVWHKDLLKTGTDYDKFMKFYQALINDIKSSGAEVIVCTPAVIGEKKQSENKMDAELDKYSEGIRQLSVLNNVKLCDLREIFTRYIRDNNAENTDKNILTYDGVHLNDLGNKIVAEHLYNLLK